MNRRACDETDGVATYRTDAQSNARLLYLYNRDASRQYRYEQVCRTLTTWHCPHSSGVRHCSSNRSKSPVRRAHKSNPGVPRRSGRMGQTDGRTDGRTPYRFIDPAPHTMRSVPIVQSSVCCVYPTRDNGDPTRPDSTRG